MDTTLRCRQRTLLGVPALLVLCAAGSPASLTGKDLTAALQRGGYAILMRHGSSPGAPRRFRQWTVSLLGDNSGHLRGSARQREISRIKCRLSPIASVGRKVFSLAL